MSTYFEIAYAAASERLCLFTGTGFSKAITQNQAPGWQELLERCCKSEPEINHLLPTLFPSGKTRPLSLDESAQVMDLELKKHDKSLHRIVANLLQSIPLAGDNSSIQNFLHTTKITIATTNFDKLAELLVGQDKCSSIAPGLPIPRASNHAEVFHVHGSIDSPVNMVITSEDYFDFLNYDSYFSKKLSTILHENTIVILGYSLGDTNLKAIFNNYKSFSNDLSIGNNIFFISKDAVDQCVKDYYSYCYGIRVLDQVQIVDFFKSVQAKLAAAQKCAGSAVKNLNNVLFNNHKYTDDYLKVKTSFFEIVASVATLGKSINDPLIVKLLGDIINKKVKFSGANGAWEQYEHLASWLTYLGSLLDIGPTAIRQKYLDAVYHSMKTMSRSLSLGYSWHAYSTWNREWLNLIPSNRTLIKTFIPTKTSDPDAIRIINKT